MQKPESKVSKIYKGRFVKESIGDRYPVHSGQTFIKKWTFRNEGAVNWPEDTIFVSTNGDDLQAIPVAIEGEVVPNQEYIWEVDLTAPAKPGRYTTYFRMVTGNNHRFGHKVWCDIKVEEANAEQPMEVEPIAPPTASVNPLPEMAPGTENCYDEPAKANGIMESSAFADVE